MQKEKRKYLNSYLIQQAKINRLKEMINNNPNQKRKYIAEINSAEKLRNDIENAINSLEEPVLRELLYQKYVLGKTMEEVSYIINYSLRHSVRLHSKALDKININIEVY